LQSYNRYSVNIILALKSDKFQNFSYSLYQSQLSQNERCTVPTVLPSFTSGDSILKHKSLKHCSEQALTENAESGESSNLNAMKARKDAYKCMTAQNYKLTK